MHVSLHASFRHVVCGVALTLPLYAQHSTDLHAQIDAPQVEQLRLAALPPSAEQAFEVPVSFEGTQRVLRLAPHTLRSPLYSVRVQGADGLEMELAAPAPTTLRGSSDALGEVVAASLGADGLRACVLEPDGGAWVIEPSSRYVTGAAPSAHVAYRPANPFATGTCGADDLVSVSTSGAVTFGGGASCLDLCEIAFDINYEYFAISNDVNTVVADVDLYMNAVAAIHARDFLVDYEITNVLIRTAPGAPYTSNDPGTLLNAFRDDWNANQGGVQRDITHLIVGQEMDTNVIGLAYVGVICNTAWGYALTQGNLGLGGIISVLSHELGHGWSAPHCQDASPCNQMCGGCNWFGPNTVEGIRNYVAGLNCLGSAPAWSSPLAPYALPDEVFGYGAQVIDVLGNDHDGNCDPLTIDAFDGTSLLGGSVALSAGTGPGGRDELAYTPPAPGFQGTDTFAYTVGDGLGGQATTEVDVHLRDEALDLVLHLKHDEASGTFMNDSSIAQQNGTYFDTPLLGQPGVAGTAVEFDGVSERARHPNHLSYVQGLREDLSIALWVRPQTLVGWQRYYGNRGSWSFGQRGDDLVFTTYGLQDAFVFNVLVPDQWQHVVAVFEADRDVRIYANGFLAGIVNGTFSARRPRSGWYVGTQNDEDQYFDGLLDDIQVYDDELSSDDVWFLFTHPGETLGASCGFTSYCPPAANSAGAGAQLGSSGSNSIGANDLQLIASHCPPGQFGLFFYGGAQAQVPLGDGTLCVGGQLYRLPAVQTDIFGIGLWPLDIDAPPQATGQIAVGSEWNFQFWYRDPPAGGAGFNFSEGLTVVFCP